MFWAREGIKFAGLALLISLAHADSIDVNTTTDDDADNTLCSLREAITYFNLNKPKDGYQGCVTKSSSSSDSISLNAGAFELNKGPLIVQRALNIAGAGIDAVEESGRTIINVNGAFPAFIINYNPAYKAPPVSSATAPMVSSVSEGGRSTSLTASEQIIATEQTPTFVLSKEAVSAVFPQDSVSTSTYAFYEDIVTVDAKNVSTTTPTKIGPTLNLINQSLTLFSAQTLSAGVHNIYVKSSTGVKSDVLSLWVVPQQTNLAVSLSRMEIRGCATKDSTINCAATNQNQDISGTFNAIPYTNRVDQVANAGGIIFNSEALTLDSVILSGGNADKGGAIYNRGAPSFIYTGDGVKTQFPYDFLGKPVGSFDAPFTYSNTTLNGGVLKFLNANGAVIPLSAGVTLTITTGSDQQGSLALRNSLIKNNKAQQGSAIYSDNNVLTLSASSIVYNTASNGAVVYINTDQVPTTFSTSSLINVTVGKNSGLGVSARKNSTLNNVSLIENTQGAVDFNGAIGSINNSIILENSATECLNVSKVTFLFNAFRAGGGCTVSASPSANNKTIPSTVKAITAISSGTTDVCSNYAEGLLCDISFSKDLLLNYKPRLLSSFASLNDPANYLINTGSSVSGSSCASNDQRGKTRVSSACDIGAIELIEVGDSVAIGGSATTGKIYTESLSFNLEDEELLAATLCPTLANVPAVGAVSNYSPNVPGCPWVEQPPIYGVISFNSDGSYTYTPTSSLHGFDRFTIRVITSVSNLNSQNLKQSRLLKGTVIVEPASGISSSSVGGSAAVFSLIALCLMGLIRHNRRI